MSFSFADFDVPEAAAPATIHLEWNGQHLDSQFTDKEAAAICERIPVDNSSRSYTAALISDLNRYGSLFPNKRYWLHEHAYRQIDRERVQAEAEELRREAEENAEYGKEPARSTFAALPSGRVERIASFLTPGAGRIPTGARVVFESGEFMVSIVSTSKDKSRWPGGFLVIGETGFDKPKTPLAAIDAQGYLYPSEVGAMSGELAALLDEFEADPAEYVAKMGVSMGNCCFCRRDLSEPISLTMGYGPICAGHYGLPWSGEAMAAKKARQAMPQCSKPSPHVENESGEQ